MATLHDFPGTPTFDDPLKGCPELARIALVGTAAILEAASKPIVWAWEGTSEQSSVTMLAGTPGGGKTTLLFLLLVSRLSGGQTLLGKRVAPARGYVVLVEGEHGDGSASRKLVSSARALGVPDSVFSRIVVIARSGVLVGDSRWEEIVRMVRAGIVSDIAIDTLARCSSGDANSEEDQTAIMKAIGAAIESGPPGCKPNVWLNAHTNKAAQENENPSINDVSGSTARVAQCDSVLIVRGNREDGKMVSSTAYWVKVREAEESSPVTYSTRDSHLSEQAPPAKNRGGRPRKLVPAQVAEALQDGPMKFRELKEKLGTESDGSLNACLQRLIQAGQIEKTEHGYAIVC